MIHILLLPGVLLHELSHLIIGILLWAKPVKFSIIPNRSNNSSGEVHFKNITFYNAFPIAFAPIAGGVSGITFVYYNYLLVENDFFWKAGFVYLMFIFARTAFPSSQDIKVAFSYPLGALMYICIITGLLEFHGITNFVTI